MWVGLLGQLVVRGETGALTVSAGKQRVVLAALALRVGQVVSFDDLTMAIWEGMPPPGARATLRNYVRRLRQVLGPDGRRIVTRDPGYLLDMASGDVDVAAFEAYVRAGGTQAGVGSWSGAVETLGRALALWRGRPLVDVPSPGLRREWVTHLEHERLQALEWQINARLRLGDHDGVIAELERLAAQHPLRERWHALLMLALYRSGRVADALAAYRRARQLLIGELGVEPGEELQQLHQQVLSRDPALTTSQIQAREMTTVVPRQLPAAVAYFTGRAGELKLLDRWLGEAATDGETLLVVALSGPAGIGKTALVVHFAHRVAQRFPDGQLYVDLSGFGPAATPVSSAEVIRGFLGALGIPPQAVPVDARAQVGLYRSLLAGKQVLVVLDNAVDPAQVRPLLPGSPGCLVLVTSRNQLTGLAAADGARLLILDVLDDAEALGLLARFLGTQRLANEPTAAAELARLCVRLPLALTIAAARAAVRPGHPLAALVAELGANGGRLDALDTGEPASSVRAAFSWSYRRLRSVAARTFQLLAMHPGPDFTAPAAASLIGTALPQTRRALNELTMASVLAERSVGRYGFHDLLREYAAEQALASDDEMDWQAATGRALDHYLYTAHPAALLLNPAHERLSLASPSPGVVPESITDRQQALAWFRAEYRVLSACVARAAATGFDAYAWKISWAVADFLHRRGHWTDGVALQHIALAAATRADDIAGQALSARLLGNFLAELTEHHQARVHWFNCLEMYRQLGDTGGEARVHQSISCGFAREGRYTESLGHAELALALFRTDGDQAGEADALNTAGWCHAHLGEYQRAIDYCRRAIDLHLEVGNAYGEAAARDSLGYAEYQLGRLAEAATWHKYAVSLFRKFGDRYSEASALTHLGDVHRAAHEPQAALEAWRKALKILNKLHHANAGNVRARLRTLQG